MYICRFKLKVGMGSGRTYERAKIVVNKIDELKKICV